MQLFTTQQDIEAAIAATKEFGEKYKANYIANATEKQRNSKHFDIGYDFYYGNAEHLQLLAQCGFQNIEEYETAYEKAPNVVAYKKFNEIFRNAEGSKKQALIADLKSAGFWNEDTGVESGLQHYAIAAKYA